jgi:PleD family two-component response regulator
LTAFGAPRGLKPPNIDNTTVNNRQGSNSIMANILVVDDELGIRDLLSEILNDEGHQVDLAENAAQARAARFEVFNLNFALVFFHNFFDDGQSQPSPFSFGGCVGLK